MRLGGGRHGFLLSRLSLMFCYLGLVCTFEWQSPVAESVGSGSDCLGWTSGGVSALSLSFSIPEMGMIIVPAI